MNKELRIICNEYAMVYFKEFWRPFPEKKRDKKKALLRVAEIQVKK